MLHSLGHYRAYGIALLVVLSTSLSFADFGANDSRWLQDIWFSVTDQGGIHALLQHQRGVLESIDSKLSPVPTISSDVSTIKQYLDYNLNGDTATDSMSVHDFIVQFNQKFFKGVDRYDRTVVANPATVSIFSPNGISPFVEPGKTFQNLYTSQIAVTNVSETYWLERIARSRYIPFDFNTFLNGNPSQGNATSLSTLVNYYRTLGDAWQEGNYSQVSTIYNQIYNRFGQWRWEPWNSFFTLNPNILIGARGNTNNFVKFLSNMRQTDYGSNAYGVYWASYYDQYSTRSLREHLTTYYNNTGISSDTFNPTNFFTAEGAIENDENCFTNETSVFGKFASSFLPSGLLSPQDVETNLFEYVDADISPTPSFNPQPLQGGTRSRSSPSFDYDFEDGDDYSYNLVNPLKTATDVVQNDTDIDNKFESLAELVNQRISSIFDSPLNNIKQQPSRWSVKFRDKDGHTLEEYVTSQQLETQDGIKFVCWVIESTMFAGFFFTCVRRSLRIGNSVDPTT